MSLGMDSRWADGNDVIEVEVVTREVAKKCREGKGPAFIEFETYRMRGHVGPDDKIQGVHTDIRPEKEVEEWRGRDPIEQLEKEMMRLGSIMKNQIELIKKQTKEEVEEAHRFARECTPLSPEELSRYVFAPKTEI